MHTTDLTDHFIIAMPGLEDINFDHSVTYICEHDDNGSFGIIINKQTELKVSEVLEQMKIDNSGQQDTSQPVYLGGPVQPERGFILHSPTGDWNSSLQVNEHIALTTSRDILEAIALNAGPEHSIVALGYAGWGPGQLEKEMAANSWLSCKADEQIIFHTASDERWQAAADILGVDLSLLSNDAGHA
jgi:putative transcriptional regulator